MECGARCQGHMSRVRVNTERCHPMSRIDIPPYLAKGNMGRLLPVLCAGVVHVIDRAD